MSLTSSSSSKWGVLSSKFEFLGRRRITRPGIHMNIQPWHKKNAKNRNARYGSDKIDKAHIILNSKAPGWDDCPLDSLTWPKILRVDCRLFAVLELRYGIGSYWNEIWTWSAMHVCLGERNIQSEVVGKLNRGNGNHTVARPGIDQSSPWRAVDSDGTSQESLSGKDSA